MIKIKRDNLENSDIVIESNSPNTANVTPIILSCKIWH